MVLSLSSLRTAIASDPGLLDNVTAADLRNGLAAVDVMNQIILQTITAGNLNDDGLFTLSDMETLSTTTRANTTVYNRFLAAHGDDEWSAETGYHLLQNDGGSLLFQGQNFLDTVADAIFHFGFTFENGRFVNEDGNENEKVSDVAGWLNYFLNGTNVVYGSDGADQLSSGTYSAAFTDAADETWYADAGNDSIWADLGNDTVWAGVGNDKSGGGYGNDTLQGEAGDDTLWGEQGHDLLVGGEGNDVLGAATGRDTVWGGAGNDQISGEAGNDVLAGDAGSDRIYGGTENDSLSGGLDNDTLSGDQGNDLVCGGAGADAIYGSDGADRLKGNEGNDTLSAGEGADNVEGGAGSDQISLWENTQVRDTLVFRAGDSGKTLATIDTLQGFDSGVDKIDLRSFAGMVLEELDYRGDGTASCYFDGRHLRIDHTGDAVTDMIIAFKWQDELVAGDFLFA